MARLLLIDDDDLFRPMLRTTLEQLGHTVTEARNGKEGLDQQARAPATLVLTDLIMPEKEGIETILELRQGWPDVKIIAMSGGGRMADADYLPIALQVGAHAVLHKPFTLDELEAALQRVLAGGREGKDEL
jgi:CheY-like chemotaxis protein